MPLHDDLETVESLWVAPAEAIRLNQAGELALLPPTLANLAFLARWDTADEAIAGAAVLPPPSSIQPKGRFSPDGRFLALLMPGDPGYDEAPDYEVVDPSA